MRIAYFCFIVATLAALTGMGLGISMGMAKDFSLTPVHAHLNLLGWVTMALYGLYYRAASKAERPLAWVQVLAAALGFPLMTGGLAIMLSVGSSMSTRLFVIEAEPIIIAGALLSFISMALFLIVVMRDAFALAGRAMPTAASAKPA